ncbi:MAG: hypothetical protein HIU85_19125 [Proteobacteria bacterium]|nr:hypothetical protein [Pseudomonadota bacterium]
MRLHASRIGTARRVCVASRRHAVYLARRYVPARIRLFIEYVAQAFAQDEPLRS